MTCRISAAGEVEQDFGLAHRGERGVIWKRDGHGLKIKEKQAEARRGLRGMARGSWRLFAVVCDCLQLFNGGEA